MERGDASDARRAMATGDGKVPSEETGEETFAGVVTGATAAAVAVAVAVDSVAAAPKMSDQQLLYR